MTLFQNKYRVESTRLKNYDYSSVGAYFITICTKNRDQLFGYINNCKMLLSPIGKIARLEWEKSFEMRRELLCDEYVIMPNHIHGIIIINVDPVETQHCVSLQIKNITYHRGKNHEKINMCIHFNDDHTVICPKI